MSDYINKTKCDLINSRRCINGVRRGEKHPDAALHISDLANEWLKTIESKGYGKR